MEIVDLDEVIDLNTPSASPSGSIIIEPSDVSGSNVLTLPHAAEVDNGKTLSMQDGTQRNSEKELGIRSSAAQTCDVEHSIVAISPDTHRNYPFPIPSLPAHICQTIAASPVKQPKTINHLPHLDLLSFEPYLDAKVSREYGEFLRRELPFYRVEYKLTRFGKVTDIMTPRYTLIPAIFQTVFGVDETSRFTPDGSLVETSTGKPVAKNKYKTAKPRPIPSCLDELRKSVERATETTYNYALVNYYATGSDSISYHSDDEHFLEKEPAIASFSFLGVRDFLLKHKPPSSLKSTATTATATATTAAFAGTNGDPSEGDPAWHAQIVKAAATPLKFSLRPGTLILMRGTTQGNWLHSIPKRAGDGGGGGSISRFVGT
ncbi:hypothetical protein QFC19_001652 [Naganishia cerealis]|uniref:Uncharacterized protein n=1 Tax=Naganishia cerealis TaxID=610337 RepID=A0ACC2WGG1_9TREE|nr:hypothetical protein QFC19_001652 [Naganishia cerealis]